MATPSSIEVFNQALPALLSGDVQAWLDLLTDDVVFEFPFAPPGRPGRVEGKKALREYLSAVSSRVRFDGLSNLVTHQTVNPDVAVIEMTATGKVEETGAPYERSYVAVLTVRDGRISHYRDYWNPLESLFIAERA